MSPLKQKCQLVSLKPINRPNNTVTCPLVRNTGGNELLSWNLVHLSLWA